MVMKIGTGGADILVGTDDNDVLRGLAGDDRLTGGKGADVLDGGAGIDTALYDTAADGVAVDLLHRRGLGGDASGDSYASIENISGSAFGDYIVGDDGANVLSGNDGADALIGYGGNDVLLGGTGDDQLDGGLGADQLDGGAGRDTARYDFAHQAVGVDLGARAGFAGEANGDSYTSIEDVVGSAYNDVIRGDAGANGLYGSYGNDSISGGAGADRLDGGDGIDTLDYSASADGVFVNLAPGGQVSGGDAQGDTITGFENIIGSAQADALIGDGGANRLSGGAGNDFIVGGAGDDVVAGGAGADQMYGGPGVDTVDYRGSAAGVVVDLLTGLGSGGDAQGDTIIDFENVIGSGSGDTLRGNAGANALSGGAGGDSLSGGLGRDELVGGLGRDELTGGADADRFEFIRTTESGKTAATRDVIHDFNHGEGDRLVLAIDANADKPGMQTLSFIGSKGFTAPGQVRFFFEGDHTVVEVNTAGKSGAEMQIQLDHHVNLGKGDFAFAD